MQGWGVTPSRGARGWEEDEKAKDPPASNWYKTKQEFERGEPGRQGEETKGGWG